MHPITAFAPREPYVNQMKIAILTSGFLPVIDGVTVTVFNRVKRLSQLGHQVLLLCPDYSATVALYPDWHTYTGTIFPGVQVCPLESSPFMGLEFDRNVKKTAYPVLLKALAEFQPDLIHVDEPERLQLGFDKIPAVDFAKQHAVPCVSFLHTNFIEYIEDYFPFPSPIIRLMQAISRRIVSRIYNAYDATLISSPVTYQKAVKMGIKNAIQAELLGVDLAKFDSHRTLDFWQRRYQIPGLEQKVKLIFLGRLTPDKGWHFTLRAFSRMANSPEHRDWLSSVALIIAGDGPMQAEIAKALARLPLAVHFLGRVAPDAVPLLLLNSDIHVTTSEKETRGLTLLEAFAAGIPVLAPQAGGIVDTLQSGQTGLLFEPQNWTDFAAKLRQLVTQPDLRRQMGQTAKAYAANYDWDTALQRLLDLWQQIICGSPK
jgi:glycosyltransferase involved in cell wall biosynthesis